MASLIQSSPSIQAGSSNSLDLQISKCFVIKDGSQDKMLTSRFKEMVKDLFKKKTGMKLLKTLFSESQKTGRKVIVQLNTQGENEVEPKLHPLLNFDPVTMMYTIVKGNKKGDKRMLDFAYPIIALGHEFIHLVRLFQTDEDLDSQAPQSQEFYSKEEELTIKAVSGTTIVTDGLYENALREDFGLLPRDSHIGFTKAEINEFKAFLTGTITASTAALTLAKNIDLFKQLVEARLHEEISEFLEESPLNPTVFRKVLEAGIISALEAGDMETLEQLIIGFAAKFPSKKEELLLLSEFITILSKQPDLQDKCFDLFEKLEFNKPNLAKFIYQILQ